MRVATFPLLVFAIVACAGQSPSPATPAGDTHSNAPDWRALIGDWTVEFRVDSVRKVGASAPWSAGSYRSTRGALHLSDSTSGNGNVVQSSIRVDFDSLLGRPMSCYDPRPTTTGVERDGDNVRLRFTPNGFDCGFAAAGTLAGDSVVGTWDESGFAGPTVMGRFRMVRAGR
ncbi:MAG TPA: hypothetical protein VFD67_14970 [Gemmatimonadaceae bacterium]|nr:hypothetical protein [Gemmatimonadaceae bacterium]